MKIKYYSLYFLFSIALVSSVILSFAPVSQICNFEQGCEVVHFSPYNYTFNIQNSHYGIAIFSAMIFLILSYLKKPGKRKRLIVNLGTIIGFLTALRFIYIQEFVLNAYCKFCMVIDISMAVALIIVLTRWKK